MVISGALPRFTNCWQISHHCCQRTFAFVSSYINSALADFSFDNTHSLLLIVTLSQIHNTDKFSKCLSLSVVKANLCNTFLHFSTAVFSSTKWNMNHLSSLMKRVKIIVQIFHYSGRNYLATAECWPKLANPWTDALGAVLVCTEWSESLMQCCYCHWILKTACCAAATCLWHVVYLLGHLWPLYCSYRTDRDGGDWKSVLVIKNSGWIFTCVFSVKWRLGSERERVFQFDRLARRSMKPIDKKNRWYRLMRWLIFDRKDVNFKITEVFFLIVFIGFVVRCLVAIYVTFLFHTSLISSIYLYFIVMVILYIF